MTLHNGRIVLGVPNGSYMWWTTVNIDDTQFKVHYF